MAFVPRWTIYTIGYDGAETKVFFAALKQYRIRTLLDIRVSPNSNKAPDADYKLANIKQLCVKNDMRYEWKGQQFGGLHQTKKLIEKLSDNTRDNASFFLRATFNLIEHPVCIMCTESKMEDCVRRHIADALITYNLANIKHIFIDVNNKNRITCYDYAIDKKVTKVTPIDEGKDEGADEQKTADLPNDTVAVNSNIEFVAKLPQELTVNDTKGFKSALCIIPPTEIWPSIQQIREKYDAAYYRWQPHLNVLYPFVGEQFYPSQVAHIEKALSEIAPFEIEFNRFNFFDKGTSAKDPDPSCYVFLQPSPLQAMGELQKIYNALTGLYPFCKSKKHNKGFTGHLTVGQFPRSKCFDYVKTMNAEWKKISFQCDSVCLIARTGQDTPFEIRYRIKLGGTTKK